jgi:acyl-CoA thioester hydrolase
MSVDTLPYQSKAFSSEVDTGSREENASKQDSKRERTMQTDATYRGTVYPWQCDHVGHMNIMWYVGKFDEANWNLFARLGLTPSYLRDSGRGMAAVQQNISYKRELLAGDIVEVTSRLLEIKEKSIRFLHEMRNAETGEIAAISEITGVHMDRQARKSAPFAPDIRNVAMAHLNPSEPALA